MLASERQVYLALPRGLTHGGAEVRATLPQITTEDLTPNLGDPPAQTCCIQELIVGILSNGSSGSANFTVPVYTRVDFALLSIELVLETVLHDIIRGKMQLAPILRRTNWLGF